MMISACSAPSIKSNVQSEPVAADALFNSADNFFQLNSNEKALTIYRQYLDHYPFGSKADLALMRIATIYADQKNDDAKLDAYQRLIAKHPESRFIADARILEKM